MKTLKTHGISLSHKAQQLKPAHFTEFDYILCMDTSNLANANRIKPSNSKAIVCLFGDFDPKGEKIIEDPYYGGDDGFQVNYEQIVRCSMGLLKHLNLMN